jgi:UDP-glucose 4-epimerase
MQVTILRLAMVYGRGSKNAFSRMVRAVQAGWFPPPPHLGNRRSLVHVDDVVLAVELALTHPMAAGNTYIVADPVQLSPGELYDAVRRKCGLRRRALRTPKVALRLVGLLGDWCGFATRRSCPIRSELVGRLLQAECYSPARIEQQLGWEAKTSLDKGLDEMLGYTHE